MKHREATQSKNMALTEDVLFETWDSNASFSIPMYFMSFLEVDQHLPEDARYVLCTNAALDKSIESFFTTNQQEDAVLLQLCDDIGATCYQFDRDKPFPNLADTLRDSCLAKLGKLIALYMMKDVLIKFNDALFNTFASLISECLRPLEKEKVESSEISYTIKEVDEPADPSTPVGKLLTAFKREYDMMIEKSKQKKDVTRQLKIRVDRNSFASALSAGDSEWSAKFNVKLHRFYEKFVLVCNSLNEEKLRTQAMTLLPEWCNAEHGTVLDKLQVLLFEAMKSTKPVPVDLKFVREKFMEIELKPSISLVKSRSNEYFTGWIREHPHIKIDPDRLRRSELNSFIASKNAAGMYEFKCSLSMDVSSLIVEQTLSIHQYETLFIDSALYLEKKEMLNMLHDVLSYLRDVDHPTIKVITIRGRFEQENLCEIKNLSERYHQKVVIVMETGIAENFEHENQINLGTVLSYSSKISNIVLENLSKNNKKLSDYNDLKVERFTIHDLTGEAKEQLFHDHENQIIFGTVTPLTSIIHEKDDLSFLLNVLEVLNQPEKMARYDSIEHNYEQIKPWYIHRQFVPLDSPPEEENITRNGNVTYSANSFGQQAEVHFAEMVHYLHDYDKDTMSDVKKTLALSEETQDPPGCWDDENDGKVYIFLNDAGAGKTTYFTWLAWRLSTYDRSLYVIKLMALEYSTDFERLEECGVDHWNDTQIVRLLYRFIHLALFVPSVCRRTIEETDVHRAEADRCAELISLSNGRIVLDETKTKDLIAMQLIELRLFREKFNQKQLVLILDGFDEIAPYYKDVVMKCFAWFARFERIRSVYLSSRPYDFENDLKNAFQNCKMNRLKMLSRQNFIHFLHKYLLLNIEDYRDCEKDQRVNFLTILYVIITDDLKDSVSVPLLLDMVLLTLRPTIREHVNFKSCRASNHLLGNAKLDKLQLMEQFVARKLEIFNTDKSGTTNSSAKTAVAKKKEEQENKRIKQRHTLLAMYALFNSEDRAKLLSGREQAHAIELLEEVMQGEEKTGIISGVRDGIPQFVHRMFAEYFVACWLYQNMARFKQESVFKSQTIWAQPMKQVREFFN
uniref:NACHT domain-containing protein n=1 Tax=Anopheles coluzzii TaxID=1518534 RepID=A0A6E8WDD7_ANOCL